MSAPETENPAATVPPRAWLWWMSSWTVLTLFGGHTTWMAFGLVGMVAQRTAWIVAAVVYFGAMAFAGRDQLGDWGVLAQAVICLVGIVHALLANRRWLATMWGRREARQAAADEPQAQPQRVQPRRTSRSGRSRRRPAGTGQAQRRPARQSAPAPSRAPAAVPSSAGAAVPAGAQGVLEQPGTRRSDYLADEAPQPIDVNTATTAELTKLPGIGQSRARRLVKERNRRNGFASLDDFAAAAEVQPHQLVRLREAATCSPRPRAPRTFGRRLDL